MSNILKAQILFVAIPLLAGMVLMTFGTPVRGSKPAPVTRWLALCMFGIYGVGAFAGLFGAFDSWVEDANRLSYVFILPAVIMSTWVQRVYGEAPGFGLRTRK
jgi:hypothetical protein